MLSAAMRPAGVSINQKVERAGNLIDRLASYFSPEWALRRQRARMASMLLRDYDAAAGGRRTEGWRAKNTSANAETTRALTVVRDRHRELVRNNPWAAKAITVIVGNAVGYGITAQIKHKDSKREKELNGFWQRWAETQACDADGLHDVYGIQALGLSATAEGGEAIIRRRRRRPDDNLEVPLQLQVLEGDYLDQTRTNVLKNGRVIQGVEFDRIGRRRQYWMYQDHPGDILGTRAEPVAVPASEVAHVYRVDRPGQVRGMPWGPSAYLTLRNLDDFEDAYLFRQKLANCLMAFVYDHGQALNQTQAQAAPLPETLEPGMIAGLPAGKDVKFNDPPSGEGYGPFTEQVLYRVAAAYGISYEALTGNNSRVNFTSGRMGWLEMYNNIERWRWHMLIPRGCAQIGTWFLEALELIGVRTDGAEFVWTPPRRQMLNPVQEIPAITRAVRAGLQSLPEAHREMGFVSRKVIEEIAESNKLLDLYGLVLDSDPRKTSNAGLTQARPEGTVLPPTDIDE